MLSLKTDIENSKRILVTSHLNCDQDAITSSLATKLIIEKNIPSVKVEVNIESELQENVSFLKDFDKIKTENLIEYIKDFNPDLIIFTDGQTPERFTSESEKLLNIINEKNIKTALIDHHAGETTLKTDHCFNNIRSSCAEEIYYTFVEHLGFEIDKEIAEIIMTGMIFDTGVFVYKNKYFRETANTVADLVEYGVVIEHILEHKNKCTALDLKIIGELCKNLVLKQNFCYTYIADKFFEEEIVAKKISEDKFKSGRHKWVNLFLKNVENCDWGFVVYQTPKRGKYKATARSKQGEITVREFAENFGGGGHDHASGFTVYGENVDTVIAKILQEV